MDADRIDAEAKPGNFKVFFAALLFMVLLAAAFFIGWLPHKEKQRETASDAAELTSQIPSVSVAHPKQSSAAKELNLPCDVVAQREAALYPRASGYLKALHVDIQDKVEKGQLLAEIDAPEVDAQLAQSQAGLARANASFNKAQADWDLTKQTYERYVVANKTHQGSVSAQDLDIRRSESAQAEAAVQQAKASIDVAKAETERLSALQGFQKLIAPFAGTITARNYDIGALLSQNMNGGRELFRIAETDTVRAFVNVPQVYSTQLKTGQAVQLNVRNYPGREFAGNVARSSREINPQTRTMRFELHFPNPDGALFPGMYAQVKLPITQDQPILTVPVSALIFNADGVQVCVVRNGKAHFEKVLVGRDLGTELEILSGITAEDSVVINPGARLAEGIEVKAMNVNPAVAK